MKKNTIYNHGIRILVCLLISCASLSSIWADTHSPMTPIKIDGKTYSINDYQDAIFNQYDKTYEGCLFEGGISFQNKDLSIEFDWYGRVILPQILSDGTIITAKKRLEVGRNMMRNILEEQYKTSVEEFELFRENLDACCDGPPNNGVSVSNGGCCIDGFYRDDEGCSDGALQFAFFFCPTGDGSCAPNQVTPYSTAQDQQFCINNGESGFYTICGFAPECGGFGFDNPTFFDPAPVFLNCNQGGGGGGNPCDGQGGDFDGDGICNNEDCAPLNPLLPRPEGTPCNDGDPDTDNDVILADGCTCEGTPIVEDCCNGIDDDGDGLVDQEDEDCFNVPCMGPCPFNINGVLSNRIYNDGGTPADVSDDTFTFQLVVEGGTNRWIGGGQSGLYNQTTTFGPFPVDGEGVIFIIRDFDNPGCFFTINVNQTSCVFRETCTCCVLEED